MGNGLWDIHIPDKTYQIINVIICENQPVQGITAHLKDTGGWLTKETFIKVIQNNVLMLVLSTRICYGNIQRTPKSRASESSKNQAG